MKPILVICLMNAENSQLHALFEKKVGKPILGKLTNIEPMKGETDECRTDE
jgi:hypothetical protein